MTFAHPKLLWLLMLLPFVVIVLIWGARRRAGRLSRLGDPVLIRRLSESVNWEARRWRRILWALGLALLLFGLARPQWGSQVQVVEKEGVQVMVVLDISKSMLAQDLKPDRLTRAKLEISDLMNRLDGDEVGLVVFSGASFIQFPLTTDYDTARAFLDNVSPDVISRPGTALAQAIRTAMRGFDDRRSSQRMIVILSDGEAHEGDAVAAAEQAAEADTLIYAVGFGSPQGEPIPELGAGGEVIGYKKGPDGEVVLSRLDEIGLRKIARAGNGQYFRASPDGRELDTLIAEIDKLQAETLETRFEEQRIERYQIFVALALMALLAAEFIPERQQNR